MLAWCIVLVVLSCAGGVLLFGSLGAHAPSADLVISEVMTANSSAWPTPDGVFYDWLELWNRSSHSVQLSDYKLSKGIDVRGARVLPELELAPNARAVLYCADPEVETGLLCMDFKLSKDGETLALLGPGTGGTVLDVVDVPSLRKNEAYALGADGNWRITEAFTPGLENTAQAHAAMDDSVPESGPVRISELMAANRATIMDAEGDAPDWIELYNASSEPVDLTGWSLSKAGGGLNRWEFPKLSLDAGEYLVVFASGKNRVEPELHADFKLSAQGETLYLINAESRIVSSASYIDLGRDVSLSRLEDGSFTTAYAPSPGEENGSVVEDLDPFQKLTQNSEKLYINEVACAVKGGADWVELYNGAETEADLSGWWLSDSTDHPRKWKFPEGTRLESGGYLCVALSKDGDISENQTSFLQADFALNLMGEELVLSRANGTRVDALVLCNQKKDVSYGRAEGYDTYRFFTTMTPGAANDITSYAACLRPVEVSREGGWTDGATTLGLYSPDGATIYYTTDGSEPNASSERYEAPIPLDSNKMIRAVALAEDSLPSDEVRNTYIVDERSALRLVCLNGDSDDLNARKGVLNTGSKEEKEVFAEIYDYDGSLMIAQGCGLKMVGADTRTLKVYPQKAFRLEAKGVYGDSKFRARLFRDRDYEAYEAFTLRASGQESRRSFIKDALLTSLAEDTEVFYQEAELCVVYVNGEYWGVYYMREHVDPDSLCQFEGWDADTAQISILEGGGMNLERGSRDSFVEMMQYVRSHDMREDADVEGLRAYMDIENYLDYVSLQIYTAQEDLSNVKVYRNDSGDGLWRWILYDLDLSFNLDKDSLAMWLSSDVLIGSITRQNNQIFHKLMRNTSMRDYFLTRFGELLATTFSSENVLGRIETLYGALEADMKNNTARWGWEYEFWQQRVGKVAAYAKARPAKLIQYFQRDFHLTDEQLQHYFGAAIERIQSSSDQS